MHAATKWKYCTRLCFFHIMCFSVFCDGSIVFRFLCAQIWIWNGCKYWTVITFEFWKLNLNENQKRETERRSERQKKKIQIKSKYAASDCAKNRKLKVFVMHQTSIRSSIYNKIQCLESGCPGFKYLKKKKKCIEGNALAARAEQQKREFIIETNVKLWSERTRKKPRKVICSMSFFTWPKCEFK